MAARIPKVTRGSSDDHSEELLRAAKKLKDGIDRRADSYLDGTYDPGKEIRRNAVKGAASALVVLSLLTGLAFSGPAEITEDPAGPSYTPAPVVMDIDDFVNAPVDDDDGDEADEQKGARSGIIARFRQAVLAMPQSVRALLAVPLWAAGTAILTVISFLWNIIFASPLGAFIMSLFMGLAILTGLFTATAKLLFPDLPVSKILCKRNLIAIGCLALALSLFDAAAPLYWHQYPLAAALLKLILGGSVIYLLSRRTAALFHSIAK